MNMALIIPIRYLVKKLNHAISQLLYCGLVSLILQISKSIKKTKLPGLKVTAELWITYIS